MSHTPGPWRVYIASDAKPHEVVGERMLVASLSHYGYSAENKWFGAQQADNATLIAAAPDLLRALTLLYEETADYIRINNLGDVHHNRSMQLARDALNRAVNPRNP